MPRRKDEYHLKTLLHILPPKLRPRTVDIQKPVIGRRVQHRFARFGGGIGDIQDWEADCIWCGHCV